MEINPVPNHTLAERVDALPRTGDFPLLSDLEASAIIEQMRLSGSTVPAHIENQIKRLYTLAQDMFPSFTNKEGEALVRWDDFRSFIARVAIDSSAQVVSDIGEAQRLINQHNNEVKGN